MISRDLNLLLADDDLDDCILFYEALSDLSVRFTLTTVHDGYELIRFLETASVLPDIIFLDLNMPLKNGLECLVEIKSDARFSNIYVIIYSTSYQPEIVSTLYDHGATFYIRKPSKYQQLISIISHAVSLFSNSKVVQPSLEEFVIFD